MTTINWACLRMPCAECTSAILRIEHVWHLDEDDRWRMVASSICGKGHRVVIEPLEGS